MIVARVRYSILPPVDAGYARQPPQDTQVTAATAARLLVNAAYFVDGKVKAHVVAYASRQPRSRR